MIDEHETLVAEAASGSMPAIDSLMRRHLPALQAYLRIQAGPAIRAKESSMDLVQSVCREALQDLDRFEYRGEAAFKHWLFTKAMHKVRDRVKYYHAQKREVDREVNPRHDDDSVSLAGVYGDFATPSRVAMGKEDVARVEAAFDELPDEYREVMTLARVVGLSHAEIARQMDRSEEATRQLLRRASVRLSWLLSRPQGGATG